MAAGSEGLDTAEQIALGPNRAAAGSGHDARINYCRLSGYTVTSTPFAFRPYLEFFCCDRVAFDLTLNVTLLSLRLAEPRTLVSASSLPPGRSPEAERRTPNEIDVKRGSRRSCYGICTWSTWQGTWTLECSHVRRVSFLRVHMSQFMSHEYLFRTVWALAASEPHTSLLHARTTDATTVMYKRR